MTIAKDILNTIYGDRSQVLVFGHRGAMAYAPMNTISAFELAAQQGAHGVELDVQRSKDGHPVIVHDFTVDATSDGQGNVSDMTLAELKMLDVGSYFSAEFTGTRIPTLDEVFETVGRKLIINVEIKSQTETTDGVEQVVADCIARHAMQERVIVSSFNPHALQRFRAIMPDVPIGYLYHPQTFEQTQPLMAAITYEAVHPYYEMIDAAHAEAAKTAGYYINAWTVNDVDEAKRLQALGVNTIMTNNPDVILDALA